MLLQSTRFMGQDRPVDRDACHFLVWEPVKQTNEVVTPVTPVRVRPTPARSAAREHPVLAARPARPPLTRRRCAAPTSPWCSGPSATPAPARAPGWPPTCGSTRPPSPAWSPSSPSGDWCSDAGEERGAVGRPATVVEIDGHRVCGIGAEINVHHVATLALDLQGDVVSERRLSLDAAGESPERGHRPARGAPGRDPGGPRRAQGGQSRSDIVVGIAGLIDRATGTLTLAPNLGWRDVPVAALLRAQLAQPRRTPSDRQRGQPRRGRRGDRRATRSAATSWSSTARSGSAAASSPTAASCAGSRGYAGEFGHMTVDAQGRRCGCGRTRLLGDRGRAEPAARPGRRPRRPGARPRTSRLEARMDGAQPPRRARRRPDPERAAQVGHGLGVGAAMLCQRPQPRRDRAQRLLRRGRPVAAGRRRGRAGRRRARPRRGRHHRGAVHAGLHRSRARWRAVALEHVFDDPTARRRRVPEPLEATS